MKFDRRCFALFESKNWDDPLIFVWVALTKKIPSSVLDVLPSNCFKNISPMFNKEFDDPDFSISDKNEANTAVFYSINSSGNGNTGIGNLLIKESCKPLMIKFPSKKFLFIIINQINSFFYFKI